MSENKTEVFVGGAIVALAIFFVFYVFQTIGPSTGLGNYPIYASFRSLEGVRVGTDVRLAGVKIGAVTHIELDRGTYEAKSTLSIEKGIQIPDDSSLTITSEGLLGGNFVEVVPGMSEDFLQSGDQVLDTQGSVSLIQLMMRYVSGSKN